MYPNTITILIQLDKWRQDIQPSLPEVFRAINNSILTRGSKVSGWKIIEDELKIFVTVKISREADVDTVVKNVVDKIKATLAKINVKVLNFFVSPLEQVYYDPRRDHFIVKIIRKYIPLVTELVTYIEAKPHKDNLSNFFMKTLEKHFNQTNLEIDPTSKTFKELLGYLEEIKVKITEFGDPKLGLSTLIVSNFNNDMDEVKFKLLLLTDQDIEEIEKTIETLSKNGFIRTFENQVRLSKKGEFVYQVLQNIIIMINKLIGGPLGNQVKNFFKKINESVKHIILRNGSLSDFSYERIIFSLAKIGIRPETALNIIDEVVARIGNEETISLDDLTNIIRLSLLEWDPSGESASKYVLFLDSRDNMLIKTKNGYLPFSREIVRQYVKQGISKVYGEIRIPDSQVREITDDIYDNLRALLAYPTQKIILSALDKKIEIEEKLLLITVSNVIRNYFPLLGEIEKNGAKDTLKNIRDDLMSLGESLLLENVNVIGLKEDLLRFIENVLNFIALSFNILPTWSLSQNIQLIENEVNSLRKKNPNKLVESRVYTRVLNLLKTANRLLIKILKNELTASESANVSDFVKFALRLIEQISKLHGGGLPPIKTL